MLYLLLVIYSESIFRSMNCIIIQVYLYEKYNLKKCSIVI